MGRSTRAAITDLRADRAEIEWEVAMAIEFKDYYKMLGIPREASEDDIRKAFRKLARKYHPDVAKDDKARAEEKFKEVNEAYEVLSDPEKRRKYDTLGPDWDKASPFGPGPGAGGGFADWQSSPGGGTFRRPAAGEGVEFEFGGTGFSDFFEMFFGGGQWSDGGTFTQSGSVRRRERAGRDIHADIMVTLEEALKGSVRQITVRRLDAGGQPRVDTYQVKVPAGVHEGQLIRMAGQGEGGSKGGPAGDLFLRVRLERHPDFRVEESDLYTPLRLAPWEAVLGAQVSLKTLEGSATLRVPPGTGAGTRLRLRGQGLPVREGGRGDLHAEVLIEIPGEVAGEAKALWERIAAVSKFNPRD
jgi:curved DNA-binding protein